jgi:hypothetical protein
MRLELAQADSVSLNGIEKWLYGLQGVANRAPVIPEDRFDCPFLLCRRALKRLTMLFLKENRVELGIPFKPAQRRLLCDTVLLQQHAGRGLALESAVLSGAVPELRNGWIDFLQNANSEEKSVAKARLPQDVDTERNLKRLCRSRIIKRTSRHRRIIRPDRDRIDMRAQRANLRSEGLNNVRAERNGRRIEKQV